MVKKQNNNIKARLSIYKALLVPVGVFAVAWPFFFDQVALGGWLNPQVSTDGEVAASHIIRLSQLIGSFLIFYGLPVWKDNNGLRWAFIILAGIPFTIIVMYLYFMTAFARNYHF